MTAATRPDYETARDEMRALLDSLGVTVECEFVPLSRSRNAGEKNQTVNWRATVRLHVPLGGRTVLTCDYSQGIAHLKGYDAQKARTVYGDAAVKRACEQEQRALNPYRQVIPRAIAPTREDILSSLASDSDVIDHATYESWASDLGYDADSRKGEAIYRACLETALKLRAAFGDEALTKLREQASRF